ncbi:MAG: transglutaminaseTgpA domain-containing protein [Anaerolineae bacterium]
MMGEHVAREPEPTPLLGRLLRRWRPREGWLILALAWMGVISLPAAAVEGRLLAGVEVTLLLSTLGLLFGWWAGQRPWRGLLVAPVGLLTGAIATLIWGVHVVSLGRLAAVAWEAGRRLAWLITCAAWEACRRPAPPLTTSAEQLDRLADFGRRVGWWITGALTGRGIPDNLVIVGLAALLAWGLAAWAGWWLARRGQTFVALFPTGFLLPQQVYNADAGQMWLLTFLGALTVLLVIAGFHRLEREWSAAGVDYSEELRLDAALIAAGLALIVLTLSPLLPSLSPRAISEAFWRAFEEPYRRVEEQMAQSFPGVESRRSLVPPLGVAAGGLPRGHLLGGRPELSQEIALRVQARGGRPGETLYWRGQTFATYTGRGWIETPVGPDRKPLQLDLGPGEPWTAVQLPLRRNILASVQVENATRAVLYVAGEPISVDRPYHATLRAPGELISLSAPGGPDRYTVLGAVADPSPTALRAAGRDYSAAIREFYLQLPADLPAALADYAAAITEDAPTPYDKALAIEAALRRLPYTLDLPAPPKDRELVSWFLFDLRKGYCDYFATAMVMLARLSGVPARLAVGYAGGTYDPQAGRYTITEMDAHSWPELYFPGLGWIPFEPTPARDVPQRSSTALLPSDLGEPDRPISDLHAGLAALRELAAAEASISARVLWARRMAGLVNLLLLIVFMGRMAMSGHRWQEGADAAYDRLVRWGRRLGRPVAPADTPRTYAAAVIAAAGRIVAATRRRRGGLAEAEAVVRSEVPPLAEAFEATLYAGEAAPAVERPKESARHVALWSALRRLWLARWGI